jgi:UTP:GlnB (protein PII) uridylyltransferase
MGIWIQFDLFHHYPIQIHSLIQALLTLSENWNKFQKQSSPLFLKFVLA